MRNKFKNKAIAVAAVILCSCACFSLIQFARAEKEGSPEAVKETQNVPKDEQGQPVQTFMVAMRDGVKLATDVYLPEGNGPFPLIITRTPYNKTLVAGMMLGFVKYGYGVVSQDVRGRFSSEGKSIAFFYDDKDGYDTVEWLAKQSWSNGKIGTFGGSAMGITQNAMSVVPPPHLSCQAVGVAPSSLYDTTYTGGGFRLALVAGWIGASVWPVENLQRMVDHPTYDSYWDRGDFVKHAKNMHVPVLHAGGWFDIFTQGTLDTFNAYQNNGGKGAKGTQKVIMGPWVHGLGDPNAGDFHFPDNARMSLEPGAGGTTDILNWFDWCLKGKDTGIQKEPAVTYYVMGALNEEGAPGNVWKTSDTWPPPHNDTNFYLHDDGLLSAQKPDKKQADKTFTFDPHAPVPTLCGHNLGSPKPGSCDQKSIESRPDVLVFTSGALTEPVEIAGPVIVKLYASSTTKDTDFTAKLTDVYPDGRSMLILDGLARARHRKTTLKSELLTPGKIYELSIHLWSTALVFNKGHRIRVAISSSNYPKFDVNPNTGETAKHAKPILKYMLAHAFTMDWIPSNIYPKVIMAQNTIYSDAAHPSHIILPVAKTQ